MTNEREPIDVNSIGPDERHQMSCGCGCEYSVTGRTMAMVMDLAEYARTDQVAGTPVQWLDDLGVESAREIIMACDRKDVARFLNGEGRRQRQSWRKVADALGAKAPFDMSPDGDPS